MSKVRQNIAAAAVLALAITGLAMPLRAALGGLHVIDGDTFVLWGKTVRIIDIDAPESTQGHWHCTAERAAGMAAKARLTELLNGGPIALSAHGHDRYSRTLAVVSVAGRDVGRALIAEGYALPWQPGKDAKLQRLRHWCGPEARL